MTADEIDQLAVAQVEIRALFAAASERVARWEPAPFVPAPWGAARALCAAGTPLPAVV